MPRPPSLPALVDHAVRAGATNEVAFPGEHASLRRIAERSVTLARRLLGAGVRRGEFVGLLQAPSLDAFATLLGAMRAGAVPVPINARFRERELRHVVRDAGMRLLVTDANRALPDLGPDTACRVVAGVDEPAFVTGGEAVDPDEVARTLARLSADDDGLMLYTSGTTANPKGCVHRHGALVSVLRGFTERLAITPDDRLWSPLPIFHVGGIQSLGLAACAGCSVVHAGHFDPGRAIDELERERCTIAFPAFQTIWMAVLNHPRFPEADLGALRLVINVGTVGALRTMQARHPHIPQVAGYGGTESCGFATLGAPDDAEEARLTTGGAPLPGMEIRVVDPRTGADLPPGETGEFLVRGASRFVRYHGDRELTARAIDADGWFHSGDLGRADEQGRIAFVERLKDMLKVGGENVAAAEVETYLLSHPDVEVAQVVAAPDRRYDQVPAAFVQLRPGAALTEDELIAHCLGRIATYKLPRYVRFVAPDAWPMSGTKIQKFRLREQIARELRERGIEEAPRLPAPDRR
jgi:fatty-acyl-CoA synthase